MARYTPAFMASIKHRYENTDDLMPAIAADCEISVRTLHRMVDQGNWAKRSERPPRDLLPAMHGLADARALLAAAERPPPDHAASDNAVASDSSPQFIPDGAGPPSLQPEASVETAPAIERIARLVEKELAAAETMRMQLGAVAALPADAERTARTLSTLTQTLHALARLRSGQIQTDDNDQTGFPTDIDEFRRDLARRIDAFVASRADPRDDDGDRRREAMDETRE